MWHIECGGEDILFHCGILKIKMSLIKKINPKNSNIVLDKLNQRIDGLLPKLPLAMLIVGARGSGKTNLLVNLVRQYMELDVFNEKSVYLFTPSLYTDPVVQEIETDHKYDTFDKAIIDKIMGEQKDRIKNGGKNKARQLLIILDDLFSMGALRFGGLIQTLFTNGRHFNINIIITSQSYNNLSTIIRKNATQIVFFKPFNYREQEILRNEHTSKRYYEPFEKMLEYIFSEPFQFLMVDRNKPIGDEYNNTMKEYVDFR